MQLDNPRRLTISLDFPAPGDTELHEIARLALKDMWQTAREGSDLKDKVMLRDTAYEVRIRVEEAQLQVDEEGNLVPKKR